MNALELINLGTNELKQKKIESSRLDSELILSKILNKKREEVLFHGSSCTRCWLYKN